MKNKKVYENLIAEQIVEGSQQKEEKTKDFRRISLTDIGHDLIGEEIEVDLLPQTISEIKAIPTEMLFYCINVECGYRDTVKTHPLDYFQDNLRLCSRAKCPNCKQKSLHSVFSQFTNCYTIQAIHPLKDVKLDHNENADTQVKIIEESRTTKPITAYYLTDDFKPVPFGVLKAKGSLNIEIKKKPMKYFLILDEIEPEKDYFLNYKITKQDKENFKRYFSDNKNLDDDISETIAPEIIGRDLPKFFTGLTQHSVLYIRPDTLGILSGLFAGDSRCGKTVIILDNILYLSPLGCEYATAETATRTGISYSIKQVGDSWEIEWGILPLCDKMLVGLDGLHAWGIEEVMQLREARSQGFIRVRRAVKADSPARVRVLGAANLKQKVATYPTRWHSTMDSEILNHVDRNRWDFIFVFGETDISKSDVNKRHREYKEGKIKRKIPVDVWRKHIIWAWQLTPDRIKITEGTYEKIEEFVNEIHSEFRESKVKPFTNEFFNTFEKMTAAYASLKHSVDKEDNLVVKPEHALKIKDKLYEYMGHLELDKVKLTEDFMPADKIEGLLTELLGTNKEKILLFIGNSPGCRQVDLKNHLKVDKSYISKELNWFQENHLINDRTKIRLTEIGAELNRNLLDILDKKHKEKDKKVESTNLSTSKGPIIKNNEKKERGISKVDKKVESTFTKKDIDLLCEVRDVMMVKPRYQWAINDIVFRVGLSGVQAAERIKKLLDKELMKNREKTWIIKHDEQGLYWSYKKVD